MRNKPRISSVKAQTRRYVSYLCLLCSDRHSYLPCYRLPARICNIESFCKGTGNFDNAFNDELNKAKDIITKFYLNKHKLALKEIIKINKDNLDSSHLNNVLTEKKVAVEYSYPINITFKGFTASGCTIPNVLYI